MCAVVALLGLMLFMWGAAIWATFSDEPDSEESDQAEEESQTHSKSESRRDVA